VASSLVPKNSPNFQLAGSVPSSMLICIVSVGLQLLEAVCAAEMMSVSVGLPFRDRLGTVREVFSVWDSVDEKKARPTCMHAD
jgi:hypothetical protein